MASDFTDSDPGWDKKIDWAKMAEYQAKIDIMLEERRKKHEKLQEKWAQLYPPRTSPFPWEVPKTKEQRAAEEAAKEIEFKELTRPQPPYLGLGCPIPEDWKPDGQISRKKSLGQAMLGKKFGLQASKQRDAQEKARSARRGLNRESSDEDEGRSALGKAKKVAVRRLPSGSSKSSEEEVAVPKLDRSAGSQQATGAGHGFQEPSSHAIKKGFSGKRPLTEFLNDYEGDSGTSTVSKTLQAISTDFQGLEKIYPASVAKKSARHDSDRHSSIASYVSNPSPTKSTTSTPGIVPTNSIQTGNTADSSLSPVDLARRQKNREKKAKAKERRRRDKEAAVLATASGVGGNDLSTS